MNEVRGALTAGVFPTIDLGVQGASVVPMGAEELAGFEEDCCLFLGICTAKVSELFSE